MEHVSLDELVVRRAQRGDRASMEAVLEQLAPQIWSLARRMMGNDADAADASQEALIAVARGLAGFDGRSALTTWAHRVTTNACLDEIRRRQRRPRPTDHDTDPAASSYHDPNVADRLDIDHALAALPEHFRAVIVLREIFGHDYDTIASMLECPVGTVRSRLARARAILATELGYSGDDDAGNFSPTSSVSPLSPPVEKDPRP